jgi:protein-S-isoprenylcysteine O-methyltransferase Ste14
MRHPLYLSLLLAAPGFALVFDSFLAVPILLVTVIFVYGRVRHEEILLERHFEAAFLEYKNRTWALIPLVI